GAGGQPRGVGRVLAVTHPVGRDVPGVADGQHVDVGGVTEGVDDLEGGGLLALEPEGVDRVDQGDRVVLGERPHDGQAVVEVAVHRHQGGPVDDRLGQFARGDLPGGQDDGAAQPGAGGVRGGGGGGVPGGGTHDELGVGGGHLRHGHGHAAVLEGAGGVGALDLDM